MTPFKITTKWITIEVYRRSIVLTVASILLTSGVTLCNENLLIALINTSSEILYDIQGRSHSLYVGLFLILVSLFLFYLLIMNWRKEIYAEIFFYVQKSVDALGTSWRARNRGAMPDVLRPLHISAQRSYEEAATFIRANQVIIDVQTFKEGWGLLDFIGEEIIELDYYIKQLKKIEEEGITDYNPELANRETGKAMSEMSSKYKDFVALIKGKEKYRIK